MAQKKYGGQYTNIWQACASKLTLTSVLKISNMNGKCLLNRFMIKIRNNIDAKLSRAAS